MILRMVSENAGIMVDFNIWKSRESKARARGHVGPDLLSKIVRRMAMTAKSRHHLH